MLAIYLDTCILNALLEDKKNYMSDEELDCLESLVERVDVDFVTSIKLLEEVSATKEDRRRKKLRILFKFIKRVSAPLPSRLLSGRFGDAPWGTIPFGAGPTTWIDPMYRKLSDIFDKQDAHHIYNAKLAGCNFFLTKDFAILIDRYVENRFIVNQIINPMLIVRAQELESKLSFISSSS